MRKKAFLLNYLNEFLESIRNINVDVRVIFKQQNTGKYQVKLIKQS